MRRRPSTKPAADRLHAHRAAATDDLAAALPVLEESARRAEPGP